MALGKKLNVVRVIKEEFFGKIITTDGKISQIDYLISMIFANLIYAVASYFTNLWIDVFLSLIYAFIVYPITIRRLHDVGRTGKSLFWALTIIGILYVLYLLAFKKSVANTDLTSEVDDSVDYTSDGLKPQYENEKLYFAVSIFMLIVVSLFNNYANLVSAKSYYLDYPIMTPMVFGSLGVVAAHVTAMDADGIIEISISHEPITSDQKGFLKENLVYYHCTGDYLNNVLFILHDAKLLISFNELDTGVSDIMEINGVICDLMISNIADMELQEREEIDGSFSMQPNY